MLSIERHTITVVSAAPTAAKTNGARIPYRCAITPPSSVPSASEPTEPIM
jgi:hypothetical protein